MKIFPKTALEWLDYGDELLQKTPLYYGHGKDNPRDEAAALITYALDILPEHSEDSLMLTLTDSEQKKLQDVFFQRTEKRLPTPYITKQIHFARYPFYVDKRVIVPRSPIAEIIENQFMPWIDAEARNNLSLLDLCCGSGCLGIASWLHCDFIAELYLSDISQEALEVAKINIERYDLEQQAILLQSDLFSAFKQNSKFNNKKMDIILCNPPYVNLADMEALPAEYQHEPSLALDGRRSAQSQCEDGLEIVDQILAQCIHYLNPDGWLFLEVGASQEAFEKKYAHLYPIEIEFECEAFGVYAIQARALQ
jgi:ribosomal protein L3 glutamine methyltransferase